MQQIPFDYKTHNKQVIDELVKNPALLKNQLWRLENLYYVVSKHSGKVLFKLKRAQRDFYDKYLSPEAKANGTFRYRIIILKARQLGFTTLVDLWMLDNTLFEKNVEALVIAHTKEDAKEFFNKKASYALRNMPKEVQDMMNFSIQRANKIQKNYEDGSSSAFSVSNSGRGGTYQYMHISEYAKMCLLYPAKANEVITGAFVAVPSSGRLIIESTAEGMQGNYYELFDSSWNRRDKITMEMSKSELFPVFYNWTWDDEEMATMEEIIPTESMIECEIDWKEYQTDHKLTDKEISFYYTRWLLLNKDIHKLKQEYPTTKEEAFLATGQNYFSIEKVTERKQKAVNMLRSGEIREIRYEVLNGELVGDDNGRLVLYERPKEGKRYAIGGDTSEGITDGDAATLIIVDQHKKIVGYFKGQVTPDEFTTVAIVVGKFFNNALLAVEVNKDGLWVNSELQKRNYPNIYLRRAYDDITGKQTTYAGWRTSGGSNSTRDFALSSLKTAFNRLNDWFCIPLLDEMLTFVRNKRGKPEAISGKHDDLIMAAAIAYAVMDIQETVSLDTTPKDDSYMRFVFQDFK